MNAKTIRNRLGLAMMIIGSILMTVALSYFVLSTAHYFAGYPTWIILIGGLVALSMSVLLFVAAHIYSAKKHKKPDDTKYPKNS